MQSRSVPGHASSGWECQVVSVLQAAQPPVMGTMEEQDQLLLISSPWLTV